MIRYFAPILGSCGVSGGAGRHLSLNVVGSTSEIEAVAVTDEFRIEKGVAAWAASCLGGRHQG